MCAPESYALHGVYFANATSTFKPASGVQIYVGVLVKYVNFGKGWRHRLFVLKGGVLRYYKVASALNPDRPLSILPDATMSS